MEILVSHPIVFINQVVYLMLNFRHPELCESTFPLPRDRQPHEEARQDRDAILPVQLVTCVCPCVP